MEQRDLELERRVWQRVNGASGGKTAQPCTQEVPETSLRELEQRSREAANVFAQLAQTVSGMMRQMLQELYHQEYHTSLTLRGMRVLSGEEPEKITCCPWTKTGVCRALALSYRRSSQARQDYAARASSGEFAPVFAVLARQEEEKMGHLLSLIGLSKGG